MRTLMGRLLTATAIILPIGAFAAPIKAPELVETWLLPRYDALAQATAAQKKAWDAFCVAPTADGLAELRKNYAATTDAWAAVEFITFGPIQLALRSDRFNLFPDRRNAVDRSITEALADPDPARLSLERLARASAALQGLPALERLLYDEDAVKALLAGDADAGKRCTLGAGIAANLDGIAQDVRTGWGTRTEGLLAQLVAGKSDKVFFADPNALTSQLLTDLAGAYQRANDMKLLPALGKSIDEAKPLLVDRRRSGLSKEALVALIASATSLSDQMADALPAKAKAVVLKANAGARQAAANLPIDIGAATADPKQRKILDDTVKAFKDAQQKVVDPLASGLGVPLGFNALDGD